MILFNPLLILAVVLIAGMAGGALAARVRLPVVTGQILAGILIGPAAFGVFSATTVESFEPITHFALGLIAVAVGNHLHFARLKTAARRLVFLVVLEIIITPALVFACVMYMPGISWELALLLAALAVATAPATILALVKETKSKGVFVKTLVAAVALNNMACICLFEMAHFVARASLGPSDDYSGWLLFFAPLRQLGLAAFLGSAIGLILIFATRNVLHPERLATVSMVAILLTAGLADALGLSALLSCMFLGIILANVTPHKQEIGHSVFANFEAAIFGVFFTLAGMAVNFSYLGAAGLLAIMLVIARFTGKVIAAQLAMRLAGATDKVRRYLGMALIPQAGVAIGLLLLAREEPAFIEIRDLLLAVGLTVVTLNEIIGPILTRIALIKSGDFGKDRSRLIDFIHEEDIVTNFEAETKEEAISKLCDHLVRMKKVALDRDVLAKAVLDREKEMSTCVGGGLAIPHAFFLEQTQMAGVMAISQKGLPFETPDGLPVHCMILLASPEVERNRHLEVLATLAQTIGSNRSIQEQLYNSNTPAHAYDLFHAEDAEDFNYFLEA